MGVSAEEISDIIIKLFFKHLSSRSFFHSQLERNRWLGLSLLGDFRISTASARSRDSRFCPGSRRDTICGSCARGNTACRPERQRRPEIRVCLSFKSRINNSVSVIQIIGWIHAVYLPNLSEAILSREVQIRNKGPFKTTSGRGQKACLRSNLVIVQWSTPKRGTENILGQPVKNLCSSYPDVRLGRVLNT